MSSPMVIFLSGLLVAGYLTVALFFLRFWRQSRDRLFILFASAFTVLAVQRSALTLWEGHQNSAWLYALRLAAFVIILAAIVDKNRPGRG